MIIKGYSEFAPPAHWPGQWSPLTELSHIDPLVTDYVLWTDLDLVFFHKGQAYFSAKSCYKSVKNNQHRSILKAIERKGKRPKQLLDGTAGWGREAFTIALEGIPVTAVEQSALPVLFMHYAKEFLFSNALLTVFHMNFQDYTQAYQENQWPCVYLDPLFFDTKASLSKKSMELLYLLPESCNLTQGQHDWALKSGLFPLKTETLVVKQYRHAAPWFLPNTFMHSEKTTKTCRYDVFYINSQSITSHALRPSKTI